MEGSELLISKIEELIKWTKLIAKPRIRELIIQNLESELEFAIYELSDGFNSTRDITKIISRAVSHATVSNYWQKWFKLGILEPSTNYKGRYVKICSLEELGITTPPILTNGPPKEANKKVV